MVSLLAVVPAIAVAMGVLGAVGGLAYKVPRRGRTVLTLAAGLAFVLGFAGAWGLTGTALTLASPAPLLVAVPGLVVAGGLAGGTVFWAGQARWIGDWWWWGIVPAGLVVLAEVVLAPLAGLAPAGPTGTSVVADRIGGPGGAAALGRAVLWDLALMAAAVLVPPVLAFAAAAPTPLRAGASGALAAFVVVAVAVGPVVPAFAEPVEGDLDLADQRVDVLVTPADGADAPYRAVVPLPVAARAPADQVRPLLFDRVLVVEGEGTARLLGAGGHLEIVASGPVKVAAWTYFVGTWTHRESLRGYVLADRSVTMSAADGDDPGGDGASPGPPPAATVRLRIAMSAGLLQGCDLAADPVAALPAGGGTATLGGGNVDLVPRCG